jgi:large subunit ribosomal protein L25
MSKKQISFNVEVRERTGTGGAREARNNGFVPGVLYGGDDKPVAINLRLAEVLKAIETGHFLSSTATLVHKGEKQLVIPQAIQMHPITDRPVHVDLFRVTANQKIKVEDVSPGLKKGGTLNVVRHTVELLVPAGHIPEFLVADVSLLEVGDNIKISDITLPSDAEPTITDRDFTVVTIAGRVAVADTADTEETEATEAEGDAEAEKGDED